MVPSQARVRPKSLVSSGSSKEETVVQRQELHHFHSEWNRSAGRHAAFWREHGRNALNSQPVGFRKAAQRYEQAARAQVEVALAKGTAQTKAVTASKMRTEQLAEHTATAQQFQLLADMIAVAKAALRGDLLREKVQHNKRKHVKNLQTSVSFSWRCGSSFRLACPSSYGTTFFLSRSTETPMT